MFDVFNGHFDNFCFFYATSAFFQVVGRDQVRQVGQAWVHPVSPSLLDNFVGQRILNYSNLIFKVRKSLFIFVEHVSSKIANASENRKKFFIKIPLQRKTASFVSYCPRVAALLAYIHRIHTDLHTHCGYVELVSSVGSEESCRLLQPCLIFFPQKMCFKSLVFHT